jgi:hypothetical protein
MHKHDGLEIRVQKDCAAKILHDGRRGAGISITLKVVMVGERSER